MSEVAARLLPEITVERRRHLRMLAASLRGRLVAIGSIRSGLN
jgi:hypothetical protein